MILLHWYAYGVVSPNKYPRGWLSAAVFQHTLHCWACCLLVGDRNSLCWLFVVCVMIPILWCEIVIRWVRVDICIACSWVGAVITSVEIQFECTWLFLNELYCWSSSVIVMSYLLNSYPSFVRSLGPYVSLFVHSFIPCVPSIFRTLLYPRSCAWNASIIARIHYICECPICVRSLLWIDTFCCAHNHGPVACLWCRSGLYRVGDWVHHCWS